MIWGEKPTIFGNTQLSIGKKPSEPWKRYWINVFCVSWPEDINWRFAGGRILQEWHLFDNGKLCILHRITIFSGTYPQLCESLGPTREILQTRIPSPDLSSCTKWMIRGCPSSSEGKGHKILACLYLSLSLSLYKYLYRYTDVKIIWIIYVRIPGDTDTDY